MLGCLTVKNDTSGMKELWQWAKQFEARCWAIEGAGNRFIAPLVAHLLCEQEPVINIAPNLTSQYRARRGKQARPD